LSQTKAREDGPLEKIEEAKESSDESIEIPQGSNSLVGSHDNIALLDVSKVPSFGNLDPDIVSSHDSVSNNSDLSYTFHNKNSSVVIPTRGST
jgi:hypothetical protein